ncbi:Six-hairpin glycosidase-like protein [Phascolomyces articulosus]|uniref:Trehalase n=1 Tax=Phascolomyces articulosus TaxID=60185 RepID=A0AAD5PA17_9FUNG|nr:Six-hairpin glycosidase-like protein [Phascolomyces articulosus]
MHLHGIHVWICLVAIITAATVHGASHISCNSPIYCDGPLLRTVQLARLFPDSKTFVDMPTKKPVDQVLEAFEVMGGEKASREDIASFVNENFNSPGSELVQYSVEAYDPPLWLDTVNDPVYRGWLELLNDAWRNLTFIYDTSKLCDGCVTSALPVKRPFVVPGGRFREFYYWDTYFAIRGLLLSDLDDLARDMLDNLLDFVDTYGFIPNGARIYYLNRSQPPLLTEMIKIYYEKTGDKAFLHKSLPVLDKEYTFWHTNTTVRLDSEHTLNRYAVDNTSPRPESYVEDYDTAHYDPPLNATERSELYSNLASGAESGWDYSSRWTKTKHITNNNPMSILRQLNTRNIIPVDLNAILWSIENTLAEWHTAPSRKLYYQHQASERLRAMDAYLWNPEYHAFYDYNLSSHQQSIEFTPAGMVPFWLGAIPDRVYASLPRVFDNVIKALKTDPGILTTSIYNTTMQWDWPNGWPPLQYITIRAMLNVDQWIRQGNHHDNDNTTPNENTNSTNNDGSAIPLSGDYYDDIAMDFSKLARILGERYAASAFCSWYKTGGSLPGLLDRIAANTDDDGHMFEKFDVRNMGLAGSGGEYTVQIGFGWTNGVALWIFNTFADYKAPDCTSAFSYPIR